jgi:4-hydroxybenzoyl-CoA thioesterase
MARVKVHLPETLPFSTEIRIRITDINYGGHLGNDTLLSILQEARLEFLRSAGFSEQDVGGVGIIMVDAVVQYRAEVFYGDTLVVRVGLDDLQPGGCDVVYAVSNKASGREVARAKTGIAFFDYARRRVVPMPEAFRKAFAVAG